MIVCNPYHCENKAHIIIIIIIIFVLLLRTKWGIKALYIYGSDEMIEF